jgi:hypothetical protein
MFSAARPSFYATKNANRSATKRELKTDPARGCLTSVGRGCPELESRSTPLKDRRGATMVQESYLGLKAFMRDRGA